MAFFLSQLWKRPRREQDEPSRMWFSILVSSLYSSRSSVNAPPSPRYNSLVKERWCCPSAFLCVVSQCALVLLYVGLQTASIFITVILQLHGRYSGPSTLLFTTIFQLLLTISGIVLCRGLSASYTNHNVHQLPTSSVNYCNYMNNNNNTNINSNSNEQHSPFLTESKNSSFRRDSSDYSSGTPTPPMVESEKQNKWVSLFWHTIPYALPPFIVVFLLPAPSTSLRQLVAALEPTYPLFPLVGTHVLLMFAYVFTTGIFYIFSIGCEQWAALLLLCLGVCFYWFFTNISNRLVETDLPMPSMVAVFMVLFQGSLSAFAGVYNEYAFKKDAGLSIHVQNFIMYSYTLLFCIANCLGDGSCHSSMVWNRTYVPLQLLASLAGPMAGIVLRYVNAIVKVYADVVALLVSSILMQPYIYHSERFSAFVLGNSLLMVAASIYLMFLSGAHRTSRCRSP